jgi:hypothetical protein
MCRSPWRDRQTGGTEISAWLLGRIAGRIRGEGESRGRDEVGNRGRCTGYVTENEMKFVRLCDEEDGHIRGMLL